MNNHELEMKLQAHSDTMKSSIDAPFDISKAIRTTEMKRMDKKTVSFPRLKKVLYGAAAAAAVFVLTFNCIPTFAYAASSIPLLGDVVRIVTFGRFEVREENYEATVTTPKIEGLLDKELEDRLNKELASNADTVIAAFESDVKHLQEECADSFHLSVTADYEIKTDNNSVLAVDFYITNTEASASTTHRFYTIDKKAGVLLTLESLFAEKADYITPISNYILEEMKRQNEAGTGYYSIHKDDPAPFESIDPEQNFYINDAGNIVICFDEHEVAAGAQGSPEFEIPNAVIGSILK